MSKQKQNNEIEKKSEYDCLYIGVCSVPELPICRGIYEKCIIYQRNRVLSKHKKGIDRFMEKYPNWRELNIGSRK